MFRKLDFSVSLIFSHWPAGEHLCGIKREIHLRQEAIGDDVLARCHWRVLGALFIHFEIFDESSHSRDPWSMMSGHRQKNYDEKLTFCELFFLNALLWKIVILDTFLRLSCLSCKEKDGNRRANLLQLEASVKPPTRYHSALRCRPESST